ncbi:hypothetical protein TRFO_13708 [Tritrichomonas foetus]|uniref:Uncharacterized protein n=1 Tax=Tritrichomonas foetus TaxID=1144522 RepID=A0A1J4KL84_9EUKA|nr:hypothetical protein TRFO_38132 [Tritrichomonas foetus]OHS96581.1 hypothetical protein TRFO_37241 [Tritrichomonas foetus]OHS97593.1 hypothetical protein TRFO_36128 [Tritrichomonas foetus]OHS99949.1 hypothetical protein TRFO_33514 [Tritrichomonas foetus]OHT00289.1 hypothetical protein TRFO_33043 [Tritrichomonas foetus]|eukprot:OHS95744.1 hypothetical protein TRFO_38132 [Tritrichomonas foetus]
MSEHWLSIDVVPVEDVQSNAEFFTIPIQTASILKYSTKKNSCLVSTKKTTSIEIVAPRQACASLQTFYEFVRSKIPVLHPTKFLVWAIVDNNGFVSTYTHLHQTLTSNYELLIATLPENVSDRLLNGKKGSRLGDELSQILNQILDVQHISGNSSPKKLILETKINERKVKTQITEVKENMDFHVTSLPQAQPQKPTRKISVWKKYEELLLALNSVMFTIETHLAPRRRTTELHTDIIYEIVEQIFTKHVIEEENMDS